MKSESRSRFDKGIVDALGIGLGLLFFLAGLWLLDTDREPNLPLHDTEGVLIRGLIVAALFVLAACLAIPGRLYEGRVLRTVGSLAAFGALAATVSLAGFSLTLLSWTFYDGARSSPGSAAYDAAGMVAFFAVIALCGSLLPLASTCALATKVKLRPRTMALGGLCVLAVGVLCYIVLTG